MDIPLSAVVSGRTILRGDPEEPVRVEARVIDAIRGQTVPIRVDPNGRRTNRKRVEGKSE